MSTFLSAIVVTICTMTVENLAGPAEVLDENPRNAGNNYLTEKSCRTTNAPQATRPRGDLVNIEILVNTISQSLGLEPPIQNSETRFQFLGASQPATHWAAGRHGEGQVWRTLWSRKAVVAVGHHGQLAGKAIV